MTEDIECTEEQREVAQDYLTAVVNTDGAIKMICALFGDRFGPSCQRQCARSFLWYTENNKKERGWLLDQCYHYLSLRGLAEQHTGCSRRASPSERPKIDRSGTTRLRARGFPAGPLPPLPSTPEKCPQVSSNMYWCRTDHSGYSDNYYKEQRKVEEWSLTKEGLDQEIAKLKAKRESIGLGKSCPLSSLRDWLRSPVGTVGHKF